MSVEMMGVVSAPDVDIVRNKPALLEGSESSLLEDGVFSDAADFDGAPDSLVFSDAAVAPDNQSEDKAARQSEFFSTASDLDITHLYLKSLSRPLLKAEDEVRLANLIRTGDKEAHDIMIESNLRLVVKLAKRYMNKGMAFLDLIAEGNMGLMRAVDKFNPDLGFRFSTYAIWWIKQSIERSLLNQTRTIRVPIHVLKELNSYLREIANLRRQISREPTLEEIARHLNKTADEVKRILTATKDVGSIDDMYDDSSRPVIETISSENSISPEQEAAQSDLEKMLSNWLEHLNENQCTVIAMRFGLRGYDPLTLESIGDQIGLTRERVRQIQIEAMAKLSKIAKSQHVSKELVLDTDLSTL